MLRVLHKLLEVMARTLQKYELNLFSEETKKTDMNCVLFLISAWSHITSIFCSGAWLPSILVRGFNITAPN